MTLLPNVKARLQDVKNVFQGLYIDNGEDNDFYIFYSILISGAKGRLVAQKSGSPNR